MICSAMALLNGGAAAQVAGARLGGAGQVQVMPGGGNGGAHARKGAAVAQVARHGQLDVA